MKESGGECLIDTTRKELCVRLCMSYCKSKYQVNDLQGIATLRRSFLDQYRQIKDWSMVSVAEHSALIMFRFCPNLFAFVEQKLGIVKRMKHRRAQNR